jgi:hypothetical protein
MPDEVSIRRSFDPTKFFFDLSSPIVVCVCVYLPRHVSMPDKHHSKALQRNEQRMPIRRKNQKQPYGFDVPRKHGMCEIDGCISPTIASRRGRHIHNVPWIWFTSDIEKVR